MILFKKVSVGSKKGFTLIELMIVVGIIAILAAIGIPTFMKYIRNAKTTEAIVGIRKIYDGEVAYFNMDPIDASGQQTTSQFISAPPSHATVPKRQKELGNWSDPAWASLHFGMDAPTHFSYEATAAGMRVQSSFTARAKGDLDGDSITSLFSRTGSIDPVTGDVVGGAGIFRSNELE